MITPTRRLLPLFLLGLAFRAQAQGTYAVPSTYQFDLGRNFFPDTAAATARRNALAERFRAFQPSTTGITNARDLYRALATADTLMRELGRHYAYLTTRSAINRRDAAASAQFNELGGTAEPILAQLGRTLGDISSERFAELTRSEPRLSTYSYAVTLARRANARRPSSATGADVALATTWGPALFQSTNASLVYKPVRAPEGELDFRRQGNQIRNHVDRSVREAGHRLNQEMLGSRRDTFALILTRTAQARNALARDRGWSDYPEQAYAGLELTTGEVRSLLASLASHADVNKRYESLRLAEIKRALGIDSVRPWDLTAPTPGVVAPRFAIGEASREVVAAAKPLGPDYVRELSALLDPRNGRLDLIPRPDRVDRPGFSTGSVGYPSLFFQGRFEGYVEDVVILAHEAGHGVQNVLMDSAGVLPRYASGPSYFTESFAMLSQLLLLEHLATTSTTEAQRQYYFRRLLDDGMELFRNAHEALVEQQLYDSVSAGRSPGADDIERLMQGVGTQFSVWYGPASERTLMWVQPIQFYTRPLYRVNYAIAKLLALQYLEQLHRDPAKFEEQYGRLLRNGYDAPPAELLQRFLGISIVDSEALVNGSVSVLESWMARLK